MTKLQHEIDGMEAKGIDFSPGHLSKVVQDAISPSNYEGSHTGFLSLTATNIRLHLSRV